MTPTQLRAQLLDPTDTKHQQCASGGASEGDRRFYCAADALTRYRDKGNPDILRELSQIRPLSVHTDMVRVLDVFREELTESFFPVLDADFRPIGILREEQLKSYVYSRYGQALLSHPSKRRDLSRFLTPCPTVEIDTPTDQVLETAFAAGGEGVIISGGTRYLGFLRLRSIVKLAHQSQLRLIEEHNRVLKQKNADIQNMLNNMRQGICTVLPGLRIHHEYSTHLATLFGTEHVAGRDVLDLLFTDSDLGSDRLDQIQTALGSILGEDALMYEFNGHLLIGEYVRTSTNGSRQTLELHWNPIENELGQIEKILVVVRDVTELRGLQAEAQRSRRELEMLGQILAAGAPAFHDFMATADCLLEANATLIADQQALTNKVDALFRNMHTLKGNARTLGFTALTDRIHEAEQDYELIRSGTATFDRNALGSALDAVRNAIKQYEEVYRTRLRDFIGRSDTNSDGTAKASAEEELLRQAVRELGNATPPALRKLLTRLTSVTLDEALRPALKAIPALAQELGKPVPTVRTQTADARILATHLPIMRDVFGHLLRNAVDHGLETESERIAHGKPASGEICLDANPEADMLTLHLYDNGRGLALDALRQKAVATAMQADSADDEVVANLIFRSGLSTAERVTTVSGRGVGMDAVRHAVEKIGGSIRIEFLGERNAHGYRPFRFTITIPSPVEQ